MKKFIVGRTNCRNAANKFAIKCFLYDDNLSFYDNCEKHTIKAITSKIIFATSKIEAKLIFKGKKKQEKITVSEVLQFQDLTEDVLKHELCTCIGFYFNIFGFSEKTYIFTLNDVKYKSILKDYEFNDSDTDKLYFSKKNETQLFI